MSVHYKFKSALEYDTVTFDGLHISVKDLKKAILQQKKIGKTSDFDLQVTNAQTKETYIDENVLIPKNASLIIARVPLTQQQKKQWEKEKLAFSSKPGEINEQGTLSQVDISSLDLSEEEKIKTMITQSTSDYDPANYVKVRGGNQVGTVPASYICFKCHQHGHWIKDCPSSIDSANMGMTDTIKKSTGIPRSFMIEVEGPQVPGARMTPSGIYAVPAIDHEVYKEKKIEKPPFLAEKEKPPIAPAIPEDLICGICKDLLQDAVMIPCCGISFCDECIRNVLVDSEESECPDCNEKNVSPDTLIPNRFLRNSVNTFKNKTGYVKSKPKLIQQRPPSPPRPSLPDFVPPPDYVDPRAAKDSQRTYAGPSPVYQGSPASALQIHHSPFQNQAAPVYAERSPYGDNSSLPDHETAMNSHQLPYDLNEYQNPPPSYQRYRHSVFGGRRHPGTEYNSGLYPNLNGSASSFAGDFTEQNSNFPSSNPILDHSDTRSEQKTREGEEMQKDISIQLTPKIEFEPKGDAKLTPKSDDFSKVSATQDNVDISVNANEAVEKECSKLDKLKKVGIDIDDVSSVSSNASEEPPPPVENQRPNEGQPNPSQGPSYAIPSLFSGQHPVILPPPGSEPYPPPRPGDAFVHGGTGGERSGTPTVDERLEVPPIRTLYDPYRAPNYMVPGYDQHYGMPHSVPMGYDSNMMYDNRGYRGMPRGPRMHRGRYAMRQPPPPGSRPLTPPRNEEEAYLAFQRMLKEKEERDKRKNEKLKCRRSTSRSRSRSATRSRRSFSGARSRSRTRSRTPPRRTRSRSKKRSRTRSRSFVMSRSRSRSYSRSPLHERNYSPKKYYSPHRSPLRYDRYDSSYGQWSQDHRDYRRGRYRGRGRGRFYKNSPPRAHEHQSYNRYRDENYVSTSPRHYRSPSRYYDQRLSPRCSDYPRDSRERDYRSYERETESAARDRNTRRRSHSNSLLRNQYDSERERDKERDKEKPRERERDRDRDRDNEYRCRSRSRRSRSRRYTPVRKLSQERSERSKDKSPERRKEWEKEKDESLRNRERRSYENDKEKRIYSGERDHSKEFDSKRQARSRSRSKDKSRHEKDRSGSKDKKKRSLSLDKQKGKETGSRKHRSSSRRRSISRPREEKPRSPANSTNKDRQKKGNDSFEKDKEKRSVSKGREELKRSASREKGKEQTRITSPKVSNKDEEEKREKEKEKDKDKDKEKEKEKEKERDKDKDKKKDKEKKKKKKEKETDEERAARKKKKKEKKEEKKRKQEMKNKVPENERNEKRNSESKDFSATEFPGSANFVTSFKAVQLGDENKSSPLRTENQTRKEVFVEANQEERNKKENSEGGEELEKEFAKVGDDSEASDKERKKLSTVIRQENPEDVEVDGNLDDDNSELQIHASYESLLEENGESQKKGILVSVPEISKWELDDNQVSDSNQKTSTSDGKSPEHSAKVTREVIKRAENAIFKKAVNAIREPVKKSSDKDDKKERKIILAPEKDRSRDYRTEQESDKMKRMFLSREKDRFHHSSVEINRPKAEVKRTVNSLQITIPLNNDGESAEREFSVDENGMKSKSQHKDKISSKSPPTGRVPIKERLGSKIDKQGRHTSPHLIRTLEKRGWNESAEESKPSRKDYQKPVLSSAIESIEAKRSSIDEAHFIPNYDESSDEDENMKSHPSNEKDVKFGGSGDTKKRLRSSSESSEESTKKHKKKKSKSKKKKQKKSKKHVSDSSDSSDSEREKKKHKKSKKKKKSRH